ncbi:MAG TPA: Holliday junction branch migration protein RuvA [Treponema sp.]|nr:Holliday junction branch migration protein RuvA [Treponema sp.]HCA19217.1 Holliday junction branch migration protein RuvA [Treponema sp.]
MFNSLMGTVTGKFPQKLFIETHGIEWDVTVPDSTLDRLPAVGQVGRVYTWLQHTDQLMNLYGFATEDDRELFFNLLKVDGIGPKAALKILSSISSKDLARILDSGDLDSLQKVPGVGKKTAAKMLLQLKGKLNLEETVVVATRTVLPFADVVTALVSMGYDKKNAEDAVAKITDAKKTDADFQNLSQKQKEDSVFREALVELAQ